MIASVLVAALSLSPQGQNHQCLLFASQNLAKGNGNWYTYISISRKQILLQAGDVFHYEVFLDPRNPSPKGGVDIDFTDNGTSLRDMGVADQNGIRAHGDGLLKPAIGKWYSRDIPLDSMAGRTTSSWNVNFEGDEFGRYVEFIDDAEVRHKNGPATVVYGGGKPDIEELLMSNGYTDKPACLPVDRSEVGAPSHGLETTIDKALALADRMAKLNEADRDIQVVQPFVKDQPAVLAKLNHAEDILARAESNEKITDAEIAQTVAAAKADLAAAEPAVKTFTARLVGYGHIDFQWLWEWQEAEVASFDTFNQAIKFMDEVPGFKFSQSSAGLYWAIEQNHPDLWQKLKEKVASGQLEIVGGRICEADTNVISQESHARQFLYGQRYFRERFGKTTLVGWEPDTFGHTIQMPQILKLGGCCYYFFCRGGKDQPLFYWQGLDGTRVLAFDDAAAGSWYGSDLNVKQFDQMSAFHDKTGSKDMLYVYGVGNHGGGPTREHLQEAKRWQATDYLPTTQFSTALEFFKSLGKYNLTKLPVISQELNPVFEGCYTTHCEIKQAMRTAENETLSAEAVSAVASAKGFAYPHAELRKNWEEILMNQHHDTMGGSGMHPPYERTKMELGRVVAQDHDIQRLAMESLVQRVTPAKDGISVMVFNPLGWTRSGWCEAYLVQSGWHGDNPLDLAKAVAIAPDGKSYSVRVIDDHSSLARFWAADVPAFGYRVFNIANGQPKAAPVQVRDAGYTLENENLIAEFDKDKGVIRRLVDKKSGHEFAAGGLGRLEADYELPGEMSAWTIGKIARVDQVKPLVSDTKVGPDYADVIFYYEIASTNNPGKETIVKQDFRLESGADKLTCDIDCDWNVIGSPKTPNPMLRVAFDSGLAKPTATYQVAYGALSRPMDGSECAGQEWTELDGDKEGLAIFNDCKYGFSASGSTMWMSLIRSSYEPDPDPNPGHFHWRYAVYPHAGDWREPSVVRGAAEFNTPLLDATVPFDSSGKDPLEWGLLSALDPHVVPTALKGAEDGDGLVLRAYESTGAASSGSVIVNAPFAESETVNFLEDPQDKPARIVGGKVPFALHGFQIKSVELLPAMLGKPIKPQPAIGSVEVRHAQSKAGKSVGSGAKR